VEIKIFRKFVRNFVWSEHIKKLSIDVWINKERDYLT